MCEEVKKNPIHCLRQSVVTLKVHFLLQYKSIVKSQLTFGVAVSRAHDRVFNSVGFVWV